MAKPLSEEAGFRERIAADPNDAGLRLIYADWLEDQEQTERALWVRYQAALALSDAPVSASQVQASYACYCAWDDWSKEQDLIRWLAQKTGLPAREDNRCTIGSRC